MPKKYREDEMDDMKTTEEAPKKDPSNIPLDTYLSIRSIHPHHHAGRKAFARVKAEADSSTKKTVEEWDAIFAAY